MSKPEKGGPRISPELLAKAKAGTNPRISPELLANRESDVAPTPPSGDQVAAARPDSGKPGGASRPPGKAKQSVPISVFLGILLVPLSAAASLFLVSPQEDQAVAATEAVETVEADTASALAQDLSTACGPAGAQLVEMEQAGTLTDLQQAALDALRPICDQNGLALPGAADTTQTAAETVIVTASNSGSPAPAPTVSGTDEHDDDDDWDDDHEDDDDWDDDHDDDDDDDDEDRDDD